MHQKDEQKAIDRVEHVRENFYQMPYAESAKRLGPFSKLRFQLSLLIGHWKWANENASLWKPSKGSFDIEEMSKMDPKIRKQIQ